MYKIYVNKCMYICNICIKCMYKIYSSEKIFCDVSLILILFPVGGRTLQDVEHILEKCTKQMSEIYRTTE